MKLIKYFCDNKAKLLNKKYIKIKDLIHSYDRTS